MSQPRSLDEFLGKVTADPGRATSTLLFVIAKALFRAAKMSRSLRQFVGEVFHGDARDLLAQIPTGSVHACISDPMFGTGQITRYDWGEDPGHGDPVRHWAYHRELYEQCLRALTPGGVLAWAQGPQFYEHFGEWFGGYRVWNVCRIRRRGKQMHANVWVVQTRERRPVELVRDPIVYYDTLAPWKEAHPCIKPVEEVAFLVEQLTKPGEVVLDPFCGLGSTLLACERLGRRWIGCDLSRRYCQIAMQRLEELRLGVGSSPCASGRYLGCDRDEAAAAVARGRLAAITEGART